MRELVVFLIAILSWLFWIGVVAPAILLRLGVPIAFGLWRIDRRNQSLSRKQYVWAVGVFTFGIGMFFFSATFQYDDWKLVGAPMSPMHIMVRLLGCLAGGWLFGLLSAPHRKGTDLTGR